MDRFGIYVHIPFCKKKCNYCDFISFSCNGEKYSEYVDSLIKEINSFKGNLIANTDVEKHEVAFNRKVNTIYFGGGTPSIIDSKDIVKILDTIRSNFEVASDAEITIEVNPGTVTKEKLQDYKDCGINRLSIGLQSTNNRILNLIGRIHTYEVFLDTYNLAKEVGFTNINVDLMLAIPTQTMDELLDSVKTVIDLNPNHISLYSLIVEEGTVIEKQLTNHELEYIDEDVERKMYWETKRLLESNGYNHYEISNFAKEGFESKHNSDCWNQEEYIGFGVASHSYMNNKRFSNTCKLEEYIKNCNNNEFSKNVTIQEEQTKQSKMREFMMIGFRKLAGVSISEFERRFRISPLFYFRFEISRLVEEDLIEVDLDDIRLTKKGLDLANIVFEEFI